jgi:catabolite regulation protein CreA
MTKLGRTEIASKTTGYREILNTQHPITVTVVRDADIRGVTWIVTQVCNGIADYSQTYRSRKAAMADFNG